MTFGDYLHSGLSSDAVMVCYAPCIRCGAMFGFNPETVPSTSVHPQTRCTIRPDGSQVQAGDADGVREPLCPPCANFHRTYGAAGGPLLELFPHARADAIDLDAARHIQASPR